MDRALPLMVRACFLFLRQEKSFSGSVTSIIKAALQLYYRELVGHPEREEWNSAILYPPPHLVGCVVDGMAPQLPLLRSLPMGALGKLEGTPMTRLR